MRATTRALLLILIAAGLVVLGGCGGGSDGPSWLVTRNGDILQVAYGAGGDFPQYAALHLSSSYLRLVPTRTSGWGTSVVVMPSFWANGVYRQGGAITATTAAQGRNLVIAFLGTVGGLQTQGQIALSPPAEGRLRADVTANTFGSIALDTNRPGEAFKPLMLSSMRVSATLWDTAGAFVGSGAVALPGSGWVLPSPTTAQRFGLEGGTSDWKTNAPTIEVSLDQARPVTGWVTASSDPNDDNVGLWAAGDTVLPSWSYTVTARE